MSVETVKLSDRVQDVFIEATEIDAKTLKLDISEAYNDSSIELSVDRATLLQWCRDMIATFDNGAEPAVPVSSEDNRS